MNINECGCRPHGWPWPWWWSVYPRDTPTPCHQAAPTVSGACTGLYSTQTCYSENYTSYARGTSLNKQCICVTLHVGRYPWDLNMTRELDCQNPVHRHIFTSMFYPVNLPIRRHCSLLEDSSSDTYGPHTDRCSRCRRGCRCGWWCTRQSRTLPRSHRHTWHSCRRTLQT